MGLELFKFKLCLLGIFLSASSSYGAESPSSVFLAEASANDRAAKRIRNEVAEEGLKTITTKDEASSNNSQDVLVVQGTSNEQLAVDHLEQGPAIIKPVITVESAPGAREPATQKAQETKSDNRPESKAGKKSEDSKTPSAEQSQKWLENGNRRYRAKSFRQDGKAAADRKKLLSSQSPHAIILSCSDSRVPPETVFDQALGEVYVVRTLGASLDAAVIASIEHAVENFDSKLIVVMGHTSCSAIEKTMTTAVDESAGSPALDQMMAEVRARLPVSSVRSPSAVHSHTLEIESSANAQGIATELSKRSELIRVRVLNGQLKIKPAMYYIDSGLVKFY